MQYPLWRKTLHPKTQPCDHCEAIIIPSKNDVQVIGFAKQVLPVYKYRQRSTGVHYPTFSPGCWELLMINESTTLWIGMDWMFFYFGCCSLIWCADVGVSQSRQRSVAVWNFLGFLLIRGGLAITFAEKSCGCKKLNANLAVLDLHQTVTKDTCWTLSSVIRIQFVIGSQRVCNQSSSYFLSHRTRLKLSLGADRVDRPPTTTTLECVPTQAQCAQKCECLTRILYRARYLLCAKYIE